MTTVNYSPFTSIFENGTNTTIVVGSPGSGKTYFLITVAANELIMNKKVFALDFKHDIQDLITYFPEVELIDINNVQNGALNPFYVLDDVDVLQITGIISMMAGGLSDAQKNFATPIIEDFLNKKRRNNGRVSLLQIANVFYRDDNVELQQLGSKLMAAKDTKYGRLLLEENVQGFDEQGNEVFGENFHIDDQSKVISLFGMELPDSNSKELTPVQSFNSAIVYIITTMVHDMMVKSDYPVLFIMDEAHIAFASQEFVNLIDKIQVLGRSLNIAMILASQSVSHYDKGIGQYLCAKFLFKSSSEDSKEFLRKFANTDGDSTINVDSVVKEVLDFERGDAFFIDRKNRDGFFHVISPLKDITSNPLYAKKLKEIKNG